MIIFVTVWAIDEFSCTELSRTCVRVTSSRLQQLKVKFKFKFIHSPPSK